MKNRKTTPAAGVQDARSWALFKLVQVEEGGAWANLTRSGLKDLKSKDRALAIELLAGVTRRRATLDWYLAQLLKQPLETLQPAIRNNLRMAVYQLCFLNRVPDSAAVDEAVKIAHRVGHRGVANLTNAVLRNFLRQRDSLTLPAFNEQPVEHLQFTYSLPHWLAERWWQDYGQSAPALGAASIAPPRICLRINALKTSRAAVLEQLAHQGITAEPSHIVPEGIRLKQGLDPTELVGYGEGRFYVQDEAAMLVSRVLEPQAGDCVLDIGAAPGGKTSHIAELTANQAEIWAIDRSPTRLHRLKENCERMGHSSIRVESRDASDLSGVPSADRILLDAPCSGLGVLARKPDLRWNQQAANLAELAKTQGRLLDEAIKHLKPGGTLVYSTCTLGVTENQEVIKAFLQRHPEMVPVDFTEHLLPEWCQDFENELGAIQLRPDRHGVDGFFIAKLQRGMMKAVTT